jgi:crossover junction endodeoxyribonuclease RusA
MGEQSFTVKGQPVPWKRTQGAGKRRYTHPQYRAWKGLIQVAARAARIACIEGPVCLEVEARVGNRKFADVDNLAKAVLDALEGIAYANDRQVCELHATRVLDREAPRLCVTIREVAG